MKPVYVSFPLDATMLTTAGTIVRWFTHIVVQVHTSCSARDSRLFPLGARSARESVTESKAARPTQIFRSSWFARCGLRHEEPLPLRWRNPLRRGFSGVTSEAGARRYGLFADVKLEGPLGRRRGGRVHSGVYLERSEVHRRKLLADRLRSLWLVLSELEIVVFGRCGCRRRCFF